MDVAGEGGGAGQVLVYTALNVSGYGRYNQKFPPQYPSGAHLGPFEHIRYPQMSTIETTLIAKSNKLEP